MNQEINFVPTNPIELWIPVRIRLFPGDVIALRSNGTYTTSGISWPDDLDRDLCKHYPVICDQLPPLEGHIADYVFVGLPEEGKNE